MKTIGLIAMLLVGCGGQEVATQTSAPLSLSWSIQLAGMCSGTMDVTEIDTLDTTQAPYARYYDGTWACGTMTGSVSGAMDVRTKHFSLNMFPGPIGFGVDGFLGADGLTGTAHMRPDVAFSAK